MAKFKTPFKAWRGAGLAPRALLMAAAVSAALAPWPVQALDLPKAPVPMAPLISPAQRLADLAERYYDAQARFDPVGATGNGDNRFDDQLTMTLVPAVRARQFGMLHEVQVELMGIDRSKLAVADALTYDALGYELNAQLQLEPFPDHLLPMNHMDSMPVVLATFASGQAAQPLNTVAQYQLFEKRLAALPGWIDAAIANMRSGMARGVVLPKALVVSLLPQLKTLAGASVETSDYLAPVRNMPASFSAFDQARLAAAYRDTVGNKVLPSLRKLAAFVETDYLPQARASSGWGSLPDGAAWYRAWSAYQTTTSMSPDEIHAIGLAEMARIRAEYVKLAPRLGYSGEPAGTNRWLAAQARTRPFKSEAEVLDAYRALNRTVMAKLPALFATMPKTALEIKAEPELSRATASDHYSSGSEDGSRPGIFWAVITDPAQYATTKMTSLFLHEGAPGHHFQIAKQQALPVPKFRRLGGSNAYVEGWALYAESLGKEMGLYEDPNAYAGHLMLDMRRAARLVVDTGLHAKGWTREQTIAFLREQAGDDEAAAVNATERYMAWPGQALGYKIGALRILALRQNAAAALGPQFNLARFHDEVLAEGPLPLALLEARINAWIGRVGTAPAVPTRQ